MPDVAGAACRRAVSGGAEDDRFVALRADAAFCLPVDDDIHGSRINRAVAVRADKSGIHGGFLNSKT
jgi:hypothetical protein